ncbi:Uncharacterised protein [Mycobacteroides abscessus subsp. massiliense]|uniref:hypothetical protein n=1 Tax=Mycobacteroides abscessus TaxID=36809 RepID=UPI0009A89066|nr:hypothetical protein [Mycobacteroides abscessus]SKH28933.1 Uncharacterised protein [Mycobacteroides abscessus subsp. massiliense]
MAPQHDLEKPMDDPYSLVGDSWPSESENSYHTAKVAAEDASTAASVQSESATDAGSKMGDEHGKTADAVSSGYSAAARQLSEQSRNFTTISAWMEDAAVKVLDAKRHIRHLVRTATPEIRDALDSELHGTLVPPSSADLITKYHSDIATVASTLTADLDAIGHSLAGDPGASRSPSYTSVSTAPTPERPDPHMSAASYTGDPNAPAVEPQQLPPMPRAVSPSTAESPSGASAPSAPSAPAAPHSTLANLIGGQGSTPTGTPTTGTSTPHTSSPNTGTPSPQAHQPTERPNPPKPAGLPNIPNISLPDIAAAAETITTAVSSATAHQLSTAAPSTITPSTPASTGITPGVPGTSPTAPMTPMTPGLAPIGGGGGLATPAVTQPAPQAAPAAPPAASQQTPTRGPAADLNWIQRNYGLAPGVELPKPEPLSVPALFIVDLPEHMARLHRVLGTLRQAFDGAGWTPPLAVATIKKGLESRTVYVTADAISIHPEGVLLPSGVLPLDEMPYAPTHADLEGSLMVTEKLTSLIPDGWTVEGILSTVPGDEHHQSAEQFQELVEAGELLDCKVTRGRVDVTDDEALGVFARAAIGSRGCGELDVESARLQAARWVGVQPAGYPETLSRYHLADAAEQMSHGRWDEAVYAAEKYMSIENSEKQAA